MSVEDVPGPSLESGAGPEAPAEQTALEEKRLEAAEIGAMMEGLGEVSEIAAGQVVQGKVLKVTDSEVIVDIGLKSEGAIPLSEFTSDDGHLTARPGDTVDVWIEDYDEQEGTFSVSHKKAARLRAWEDLERASREQSTITGRIVERTKGGLTVEIGGVRAFLPSSQADLRPVRDPDSLIGQEIVCKVIKLNRPRNNVVVSRRAVLEEELNQRRAELLESLAEGSEMVGRVKNLTDYGAFVDLGGVDGLLHVADLSWGRVQHPSEVVQPGQEIRVKVLKYDPEKGRISLGLKQLLPDPWEMAATLYPPGTRVRGRVVSLTDYGAFVEIEAGVEGLVHVSEMTWSRRLKHPSKLLKVGDQVDVAVIDVNPTQRRISLSLKQTLRDPWSDLDERLAVGASVEGRVRNLADFGAFVEIEDGVDGLIHISDLSWNKNVKHPSEVLKKGQKVNAVVLSLDAVHRRLSLGLKQLQPDLWQDFLSRVQVGSTVHGRVVRMVQFGAFVELAEGIEGLCHVSEFDEEHSRGGPSPLKVGSELDFRILRISAPDHKIGLSLKRAEVAEAVPEVKPTAEAPPAGPAPAAPTTMMGEKMAQAFRVAASQASAAEAASVLSRAKSPAPGAEAGPAELAHQAPAGPADAGEPIAVEKTSGGTEAEASAGASTEAEGASPTEAAPARAVESEV